MQDFIRSPLQFVRPMTEQEWQEMMLRATRREIHRERRRSARPKASLVSNRHLDSRRLRQAADSSGVF